QQGTNVGDAAFAQRLQVVATFQGGDQSAIGVAVGNIEQLAREPAEVVCLQLELGQWIAPMGVESSRYEHHLRPETGDGWQQLLPPRRTEGRATDRAGQGTVE